MISTEKFYEIEELYGPMRKRSETCNFYNYKTKASVGSIGKFEMKNKKSFLNGLASKVRGAFKTKQAGRAGSTYSLYEHPTFESRLHSQTVSSMKLDFNCKNARINEEQDNFYARISSSPGSSPEMQRAYSHGESDLRRSGRRLHHRSKRQEIPHCETLSSGKSLSKTSRIVIIGSEEVGKSAMTVRFLTKRFIGEYVPEIESVHEHSTTIDGKEINLSLWESAMPELKQVQINSEKMTDDKRHGSLESLSSTSSSSSSSSSASSDSSFKFSNLRKSMRKHRNYINDENCNGSVDTLTSIPECSCEENLKANERINWADGVIVLYSICDSSSFKEAANLIRYIRHRESCCCQKRDSGVFSSNESLPRTSTIKRTPIMLIGNKADLGHRRKVNKIEAASLALDNDCSFVELSVSDTAEPTTVAINDFIKITRKIKPSSNISLKSLVKKHSVW